MLPIILIIQFDEQDSPWLVLAALIFGLVGFMPESSYAAKMSAAT